MTFRNPQIQLLTHEVQNQVPPLENYNLYEGDIVLQEALEREGALWAKDHLFAFGKALGRAEILEAGHHANRYAPELHPFDRYGQRVDEVRFHPGYHQVMALAKEYGVHSIAWTAPEGGHVAHTALEYLLVQVESGVCCPLTMTYASLAALRHQKDVAQEWEPLILSNRYEERCIPAKEKSGVLIGMAMTEKQGGSDVRTNTTKARPLGGRGETEGGYELTGHKWFCSAPMCDAFLTLAYADQGLSCFLVPRWRKDGTRNPFYIQRLKDKLGNRSNASGEVEYLGTEGILIGEEGRGVATIMEMVQHTRLDCTLAASGLMRQALFQAFHHCTYRKAFGKTLLDQALMKNVLADLSLEVEASTSMVMRIARAFDQRKKKDSEEQLLRLIVAIGKYWTNKRASYVVNEAMECLGGGGYVEESPLPRLYREAPVNGIWEGSGNVICLDVLRTLSKEPEVLGVFFEELALAQGKNPFFDHAFKNLQKECASPESLEVRARALTERFALIFQASLLLLNAPCEVADSFCQTRLGHSWGYAFGTLPSETPFSALLKRIAPS
jgi:putative acyl-CoA dehydrogenase